MNKAIIKLRRRVRRRWFLRFKDWNKKEAKRIARWQCHCCTEQLIDIYKLDTVELINAITIDEIEDIIDEEVSCWSR